MDTQIVVSFFNFGGQEYTEERVKQFKELGCNIIPTHPFHADGDKAKMLEVLGYCQRYGMRALVYDDRISFQSCHDNDADTFRKLVKDAVDDFAAHPAVFGFFLGDEPRPDKLESAARANRVLMEFTDKPGMVNFFPWVDDDNSLKTCGCREWAYEELLERTIKAGGFRYFGVDNYTVVNQYKGLKGMRRHFYNLNMCARLQQKTGAACWFAGCTFKHLNTLPITVERIRYQMNAVFMHGLKGINWYKISDVNPTGFSAFMPGNDSAYPIDFMGQKTYIYDFLRLENNVFIHKFAQKLSGLTFQKVWHYQTVYGGTEEFFASENEPLLTITGDYGNGGCFISKYVCDRTGAQTFFIMNSSMELSERFTVKFRQPFQNNDADFWLAPGQMHYIDVKNEIL